MLALVRVRQQLTVTQVNQQTLAQVAITSSSNAVAWNATAAANAYHVTTENTTFSAPSNAVEGAIISVELAQGGTAVQWLGTQCLNLQLVQHLR